MYLKSTSKKLYQIKEKGYKFFSSISIPGVSHIFSNEIHLFKALWAILILSSFSFGLWNISETVNDYRKFDVITNVARVTPNKFTFPAITICNKNWYTRDHYKNGSLIDSIFLYDLNKISFKNFIKSNYIKPIEFPLQSLDNNSDFFRIRLDTYSECFRINGATNRSVQFLTASNTGDQLLVTIANHYIDRIAEHEYFIYSLKFKFFSVFISDNQMNSFYQVPSLTLDFGYRHTIEIEMPSIEAKLGEPYNQCRETGPERVYHQKNCIEACIYKGIKYKYNCTYAGLFAVGTLEKCQLGGLQSEFLSSCVKECPADCYSRQFRSHIVSTKLDNADYTDFRFAVPDFSSLKIDQIPKMNEFAFLSNIGGSLGLFMGISFLSFVEIFEFIVDVFLIAFIY